MKKNVLITGGCGFIGHHVVEHFHRQTNNNITIIDKLSYASRGYERLRSSGVYNSDRIRVFTYDLCTPISEGLFLELGDIHFIIHMAADTHVDNSIKHPVPFIFNNITSTVNILEYAKLLPNLEKIFYFSTDEVYGSADKNVAYTELDKHNPTNPYSASKSAAEKICVSYKNTYKIPLIIVNVMNAFGERQHTEKFIPKVMKALMNNKIIGIHCKPNTFEPGSRFYIHARNVASAVLFLIMNGEIGETYNIRGEKEMNNLEMAILISKIMNKQLCYEIVDFYQDRPGHDFRYCLDGTKLEKLGWKCPITFEDSLRKTIEWTMNHPEWIEWE